MPPYWQDLLSNSECSDPTPTNYSKKCSCIILRCVSGHCHPKIKACDPPPANSLLVGHLRGKDVDHFRGGLLTAGGFGDGILSPNSIVGRRGRAADSGVRRGEGAGVLGLHVARVTVCVEDIKSHISLPFHVKFTASLYLLPLYHLQNNIFKATNYASFIHSRPLKPLQS